MTTNTVSTTTTASFMRQSAVNQDQMHSFVRDKQAWENAIAMYQGPDPLDHWYNYICWYENHGHSDSENKFRETLERCLSIFERCEYYNQDLRMVRLWLKYIDMQPNPLHFYQVLFHRGTGRHVAEFYIHWANCYETMSSFKESESVFTIGFQEKAEPLAQLQNAHKKILLKRTNSVQQQQRQQEQPQLPQEQQANSPTQEEQIQVHYQQQQVQSSPSSSLPHQNNHQQQEHAQAQTHSQSQPRTFAQEHHSEIDSQQQPQQPQQQMYQRQQQHLQLNQQVHQQNSTYNQEQHLHQQQQTHHQYQEAIHNNQQHALNQEQHDGPQRQEHQQANGVAGSQAQSQMNNHNNLNIEGIRLPRNFVSYARNSNETWKPALTLEEPEDPHRICHYPKQLVYPTGASIEYSPEELMAFKYKKLLEQKRMQRQQQQQVMTNRNDSSKQEQLQQTLYLTATSDLERNNNSNGTNHNKSSSYGSVGNEAEDNNKAGTSNEQNEDDEDDDEDEYEEYDDDGDDADAEEYDEEQRPLTTTYSDDQIEASTIRFRMQTAEQGIQNKTIKIKFKKEPSSGNNSLNGTPEYSAYTIENIDQQEIQNQHQHQPPSPIPTQRQLERQRTNGHHNFHPYMLGQTSTPKATSSQHQQQLANGFSSRKRNRNKMKSIQQHEEQQSKKFQNIAGICSNSNSSSADQAAFGLTLEQTKSKTALAFGTGNGAESSNAALHNVTFNNDNANFSFSSATAHENSNCSISTAVGRLNFRDTSMVGTISNNNNNNNHHNNNNNTSNNNSTVIADFSTFQENSYFATQHDSEAKERRLAKAIETIDRHMAKEAIDPFSSELCRAFLTKLDFPGEDDAHANYKIIQTPLPKIANTRTLNLPDIVQFNIDKEVGRGTYGSVYKATDVRTNNIVALKYQKPPNSWEIYICDQVLKRVTEASVLPGLMDISTAIIAPNASLIATEFSPFGSLLDINNKIRQATKKVMHESLVMHFSAQICNIIHYLHINKIIHADIKPDNFLLMRLPSTDLGIPSLRLIDFGCAIDMTLFPDPDNTKFRKVIQTDAFTCIEMQEGRPWSYETDLFCIAGTIHVMLFGEYMQLQNRCGVWDIRQKLPRYLKKMVWTKFFADVLNIKAGKLPSLLEAREIFEEEAYRMDSELQKQIRWLSNLLRCR